MSNPKGREYGRYLSTEQFAARYAPAAADVAAVEKLLEQAGMKNVTVGPHGVYVSATATVAQLRTAFNVTQNLYAYNGHDAARQQGGADDSRLARRQGRSTSAVSTTPA